MAHTREELDRLQDQVRELRRQSRQQLQAFEDMLRERGVDVEAELARFLALPAAAKKAAANDFSGLVESNPRWGLSVDDLPEIDDLASDPDGALPSPQANTERGTRTAPEFEGARRALRRHIGNRI